MPNSAAQFNQTHSQALQTQMHSIQALQNQQSSILSAVTPLLPLLQTIASYPHPSRLSTTFGSPANRPPAQSPPRWQLHPAPQQHDGSSSISRRSGRQSSPVYATSSSSPSDAGMLAGTRKKRPRSDFDDSRDAEVMSPLTAVMLLRKRSRVESTHPNAVGRDGIPNPTHSSSRSPDGQPKPPSMQVQTPRRPLQEIFSVPKLRVTPDTQQSRRTPIIQPPSASKQYAALPLLFSPHSDACPFYIRPISNSKMESLVGRMSIHTPVRERTTSTPSRVQALVQMPQPAQPPSASQMAMPPPPRRPESAQPPQRLRTPLGQQSHGVTVASASNSASKGRAVGGGMSSRMSSIMTGGRVVSAILFSQSKNG